MGLAISTALAAKSLSSQGPEKNGCCRRQCNIYTVIRAIFIGLISFGSTYFYTNVGFSFEAFPSVWISLSVCVVVTLLASISKKIRCILALWLPQLSSRAGRIVMFSLLSWLVLSHPMKSTLLNLQETSRMVECVGNLTTSHAEMLQKVYHGAYEGLANKLEENLKALREAEDALDALFDKLIKNIVVLQKGLQDVANSINTALGDCRAGVRSTYKDCVKKTSVAENDCVAWFGKWFSEGSVICPITRVGSTMCDMFDSEVLCSPVNGVGKLLDVNRFLASVIEAMEEIKSLFDLQVLTQKTVTGVSNINNSIKNFTTQINSGFKEFVSDTILVQSIIHYAVAIPLMLLVPVKAYFYLNSALDEQRNPDIEANRSGWKSCFSIGESEVEKQKSAKRGFIGHVITVLKLGALTIVVFFVALLFLAIEFLVNWSLTQVATHGNVTFTHEGGIEFSARFEGGSVMKKIANAFFSGLSINNDYNVTISTSDCLPQPIPISSFGTYITLLIIFGVLILLVFLENYLSKNQLRIVKYFYPEEFTEQKESIRLQKLNFRFEKAKYDMKRKELKQAEKKLKLDMKLSKMQSRAQNVKTNFAVSEKKSKMNVVNKTNHKSVTTSHRSSDPILDDRRARRMRLNKLHAIRLEQRLVTRQMTNDNPTDTPSE